MEFEMTSKTDPFEEREQGEEEWQGIEDLLSVSDMNDYNQRLFQDDPLGNEPTVKSKIEQTTPDKLLALNVLFHEDFVPVGKEYLFDNLEVVKDLSSDQLESVKFAGREVALARDGRLVFSPPSKHLT